MTKANGKIKVIVEPIVSEFRIDEELEHKGIKTASDLKPLIENRFRVYIEKLYERLTTAMIKVIGDDGKETSHSLGELHASIGGWGVYDLHVYNLKESFNYPLSKNVRKDGKQAIWRPAWKSKAWSVLNAVVVNNRKPIVSFVSPQNVPDNAGFVRTAWSYKPIESLIVHGYISRLTTSISDRVEAYTSDSEEGIDGYWLLPTELGLEFHKKNTDKALRMIDRLSGDPKNNHEEVRGDTLKRLW